MRRSTHKRNQFTRREKLESVKIGREAGSIQKNWHEHHRIALVYPNTYPVGMTNLGFQRLYQIFNELPGFLCERFFLSEKSLHGEFEKLRSCESGRQLKEFDCIAFSISFEADYLNVLKVLQLTNIPLYHHARLSGGYPVILGGGCGITVNPEPLADFMDLICIGEGEDFVSPFAEQLQSWIEKKTTLGVFLQSCAELPGTYIPSHYRFEYSGSRISSVEQIGPGHKRVMRLIKRDLSAIPTQTVVIPVETPFRNMFMVETGRGCKWACRFCAAGYIYRYPRERSFEALKEAVDRGLSHGMRIGLVGSDMSCHSYIWDLMEYILERGGEPSLSSIRVEAIDARMASLIARTGIKTMTLAPDAGSFRLRRVLNKNMPDEMIVEAAARLLDAGIRNIKLYFIIGLPTEGDEDIEALIALARKIKGEMLKRAPKTGQMGVVSLSINPFIPKPGTPFQWVGLEPKTLVDGRFEKIRKSLVSEGSFKIELESYRGCYLQAFISRADRRGGRILEHMLDTGKSIDAAAQDLNEALHYLPSEQIHRTWDFDEILPWQIMDHGFDADYLQKEMLRGYQTKLIPNCKPETCRLCGVCN